MSRVFPEVGMRYGLNLQFTTYDQGKWVSVTSLTDFHHSLKTMDVE